jgi:hypothetical protein
VKERRVVSKNLAIHNSQILSITKANTIAVNIVQFNSFVIFSIVCNIKLAHL